MALPSDRDKQEFIMNRCINNGLLKDDKGIRIDNVSTSVVQCTICCVYNTGSIMKKTLSRYGNSLALILDKPILELLNITEDTVLQIRTDGNRLIITPETKKQNKTEDLKNQLIKDPKLEKLIEDIMEEFDEDLRKLADS